MSAGFRTVASYALAAIVVLFLWGLVLAPLGRWVGLVRRAWSNHLEDAHCSQRHCLSMNTKTRLNCRQDLHLIMFCFLT